MSRWRRGDRKGEEQNDNADAQALQPALDDVDDDPRNAPGAELGKAQKAAMGQKWLSGRNSHSFDPSSTLARPAMRVLCGPKRPCYGRPVAADDVIIVPEFLCDEEDLSLYRHLIADVRSLQAAGEENAEWLSWHEGAHLITRNPAKSACFQDIVAKICAYLSLDKPEEQSVRFNWYKDSRDWKPFHHDAAAFEGKKAERQNCTVGVSLGATRELAFRHVKSGELIYFPQPNGTLFYFGRDVNIRWQHGINAVGPGEQETGMGRVSIIVFGWSRLVRQEEGSPAPLPSDKGAQPLGRKSEKPRWPT